MEADLSSECEMKIWKNTEKAYFAKKDERRKNKKNRDSISMPERFHRQSRGNGSRHHGSRPREAAERHHQERIQDQRHLAALWRRGRLRGSRYVPPVHDLMEASRRYATLHNILDLDIANGSVKTQGSHSRNLRRVRQGLDLIRVLFMQFIVSNDYSLKNAATTAYSQVCAPYHTWAVRTAVYAGMYTLPSRDQLLLKLGETDQTAGKKMERYINAAAPVIGYIDSLYLSRNIGLDW
ncbi:hypothetical protein SAY87_001626 [Trapa incisa]|uniref:Glycolipid transfer protein domain-containing protein n=1 Tax=Trapa incisa TaxID=236973 RepID=A0AAN7JVB3_9MYRT|nr:hypothetical protein SAY87_001626 [Trapa incisa]